MSAEAHGITIELRLRREEGALVRLLGTIRRKRFDVTDLRAELAPGGREFEVRMAVETVRAASSILPHIEKLEDVSCVRVASQGVQVAPIAL